MGMLLSSTPLWLGMTEGRLSRVRRSSLWSTYRVRKAARCLIIPPTTTTTTLPPRAPSFPLYHPFHLTMTNPICSLSKNCRLPLLSVPPLSFLTQRSSSHLSFTPPRSWSAQRDTWPGERGMAGKGKATGSPCGRTHEVYFLILDWQRRQRDLIVNGYKIDQSANK